VWAESTALVLILYVTLLARRWRARRGAHRDGVAPGAGPRARAQRLEILIYFLVGAFGAIMAWNGAILAASVAPYKIPTLGLSEAFKPAPLVISGALIVVFSIEHVVALIRGEEVKPAWH